MKNDSVLIGDMEMYYAFFGNDPKNESACLTEVVRVIDNRERRGNDPADPLQETYP